MITQYITNINDYLLTNKCFVLFLDLVTLSPSHIRYKCSAYNPFIIPTLPPDDFTLLLKSVSNVCALLISSVNPFTLFQVLFLNSIKYPATPLVSTPSLSSIPIDSFYY